MTHSYAGFYRRVFGSRFGGAFSAKGRQLGFPARIVSFIGAGLIVALFNVESLHHALWRDFGASVSQIVDFIPPTEVMKKMHCKALILNEEHQYHYEVLESILALYPLPQLPSCDLSRVEFTISIADGEERELWRDRSVSWYAYAIQNMTRNEYTAIDGQSRYLEKVVRNSSRPTTHGFDYQIGASCFCQNENDVQWLLESEAHFCVFHGTCERFANSSQVMWVNPKMKRSFFPAILPQFDQPRAVNNDKHNLCIIGSAKRREYKFIANYVKTHPLYHIEIHFHHFGGGDLRPRIRSAVTTHSTPNYTEYQFDLYMTCDAILSLVTRKGHPEYFEGPTRLSGAVVQAAAYRKPILVHEDLATVYQNYLEDVETHGDDYDSFTLGLGRLLRRLTMLKAAGNITSSVIV